MQSQEDIESTQTQEDEEESISPEVKAFERAFQKIQNDYDRAVGSKMSEKDFKGRLKVLALPEVPQRNFLIELIGDNEL